MHIYGTGGRWVKQPLLILTLWGHCADMGIVLKWEHATLSASCKIVPNSSPCLLSFHISIESWCARKSSKALISCRIVFSKRWGGLYIKMTYYQCRNSHYKDKTVMRPSYIYNGSPYSWKDGLLDMRKGVCAGESPSYRWSYPIWM